MTDLDLQPQTDEFATANEERAALADALPLPQQENTPVLPIPPNDPI